MTYMIIKISPLGDNNTIVTNQDGSVTIDTGVNQVEIVEAFIGPMLLTADGERVAVYMRDSGFEASYVVRGKIQVVSMNNGIVRVL